MVVTTPAVLALEDGTLFRGISVGASGTATGEVVFNTAMTGYQEILTDPSYTRQIVTLTYPHIGNTGTNPDDLESSARVAGGRWIVKSVHEEASVGLGDDAVVEVANLRGPARGWGWPSLFARR